MLSGSFILADAPHLLFPFPSFPPLREAAVHPQWNLSAWNPNKISHPYERPTTTVSIALGSFLDLQSHAMAAGFGGLCLAQPQAQYLLDVIVFLFTQPSHSLYILNLTTCLLIVLCNLVVLGHALSGQPFFLSIFILFMCANVCWPAILILSCSHQYLVNSFRCQYSVLTLSMCAESIHLDLNRLWALGSDQAEPEPTRSRFQTLTQDHRD